MRILALSDIHADFRENRRLLASLSLSDYQDDALILAGDVTHDVELLRRVLGMLAARFRYVFFVPGNHELWIHKGDYDNSLEKFHAVLRLCENLGIRTRPACIGRDSSRVRVVPLFSWYTRPDEGADSLYRPKEADDATLSMWADNCLVKWPDGRPTSPTQLFLDMNAPHVSPRTDVSTISFSHFLPRQELMFREPGEPIAGHDDFPDHGFNFSRVAGSTLIDAQVRQLGSDIHVYGHQHRNRLRLCDGTWYVSNCLGYERERLTRTQAGDLLRVVWPSSASRFE